MHVHWTQLVIAAHAVILCVTATASELIVGPDEYLTAVRNLHPGDTLRLRAGVYTKGLPIRYINGTQDEPITITGPQTGEPAIFLARKRQNTVSIVNSSYVTIRNLILDGQGIPVDAIKAEGYSGWAHNITIDNLVITGHGANQQTVGISTKCPAWGWSIRHNVIIGAGTGIYLGNSDGTEPFFAGLIEYNLVTDTLGYNLQIKHQNGRILQEKPVTIIRHNVFSKAMNASLLSDARPNVLVGHWPSSGPGATDHYEIYGNLFYQNPNEALFQGEGNIAIYNNIFINDYGDAIHIQPHNDIPKTIDIFFNTVLALDQGIVIRTAEYNHPFEQTVIGNAVFANNPILGVSSAHNTVGNYLDAQQFLTQPIGNIGELNLLPKPNRVRGLPLNEKNISRYENWNRDFDGNYRDMHTRGAYGTSKSAPLWQLQFELKPVQ